MKLRVLRVALEKQHYDLAAHAIVFGMVQAKVKENQKNGKKGSTPRESKRT
jgi:hypothetical protein